LQVTLRFTLRHLKSLAGWWGAPSYPIKCIKTL
jgi:hypothetical protein